MTDRYAVVGNPVAHSLSPRIHAWFAAATGQRLHYDRLLAPAGEFERTAAAFFAAGGRGLNVTVPFKSAAAAWVQVLDPLARDAGAVNTIRSDGAICTGFNTDGLGLVRDLEDNLGECLAGRRILLIGAGGAALGVSGPLLDAGPAALVVANRTAARARSLAARFAARVPHTEVAAADFAGITTPFDVVINATSAGLDGEVPALPAVAVAGAFCYDMVYGATTAFCRWAARHGARRTADGIGMLVEQAAEAFQIWRGIRPETARLLETLRMERGPGVAAGAG